MVDLAEIRTAIKNVGSNLTVKGKKFEWLAKRGWRILAENPQRSNWLCLVDEVRTCLVTDRWLTKPHFCAIIIRSLKTIGQ